MRMNFRTDLIGELVEIFDTSRLVLAFHNIIGTEHGFQGNFLHIYTRGRWKIAVSDRSRRTSCFVDGSDCFPTTWAPSPQ